MTSADIALNGRCVHRQDRVGLLDGVVVWLAVGIGEQGGIHVRHVKFKCLAAPGQLGAVFKSA